jgi:transcriptional regulator with XRE-family HTH domain
MTYDFSVLRELRKGRGLTLAKLSALCDISYVALSKLERNRGNPELRTLDRVSRALGLATHNLLAMAEQQQPLMSSESPCRILDKGEARLVDLGGTRLFYIRAPKGAAGDGASFHRDDYERCFVLDGCVKVTVHGRDYLLRTGEGLVWDALLEHRYDVQEPSTFLSLLTPKKP